MATKHGPSHKPLWIMLGSAVAHFGVWLLLRPVDAKVTRWANETDVP